MPNTAPLILVVNQPLDSLNLGEINLFPLGVQGAERTLPPAMSKQVIELGRAFWVASTECLANEMNRRLHVPLEAGRVFARIALVLLTYPVFDRAMRIARISKQLDISTVLLRNKPSPLPDNLLSYVNATASDRAFNEALVARLAMIWKLESRVSKECRNDAARIPLVSKNTNFRNPVHIVQRIRWKILRTLSSYLGRVPVLGLAYDGPDLNEAGLIGPFLLHELEKFPLRTVEPKDLQLRREIFGKVVSECEGTLAPLAAIAGLSSADDQLAFSNALADILIEAFPSTHFESIPTNLATYSKAMKPFGGKPLLYCEYLDTPSTYYLAAARSAGMRVINVQHGAHYGFSCPPVFEELEHQFCDEYVTWGVNQISLPHYDRSLPGRALPCPWLSERARKWRALGRNKDRPFNLVLATDRLQLFPPSLVTIRLARVDHLARISDWLEVVVSQSVSRNWHVMHKPFDDLSRLIMEKTTNGLTERFGKSYELLEGKGKGLSEDLLVRAGVVVWDEPGSGFFECLAGGIPCMLWWPKEFVSIVDSARDLFDRLKDQGIVHHDSSSLFSALDELATAPMEWWKIPKRQDLIHETLNRLCRTEDAWANSWRRYIQQF